MFTLLVTIAVICETQIAFGQDFSVINTTFQGGSTESVTNNSRALDFANNTASLSQYGGWMDVQLTATGHFRTELYNDTWYMVDPDGYLYFGAGVNSVNAKNTYSTVTLPDDLIDVGLNHLANWSDYESINSGTNKIPYVFRELFMQGYKNTSQRGKDFWAEGIITVFDPAFATYADNLAQTVALRKDDPYCIGVFSDNEMPIYSNATYGELLDRYLAITANSDPNYVAANDWMIGRKGAGYTIDTTDRSEFHGYIASTYYKIVYDAIKLYAPNMLYIGSRLHGAAKAYPSIYKDSAPYIDVFSVNYYGPFEPNMQQLAMWESESSKPFIISEFYAKGFDVPLDNSGGAGYHVPSQLDRALYFENFVINLLESKGCVGYQWFKFQDDNSNRGLINDNEVWYSYLQNSLIEINKDIYNLRDFLITQGNTDNSGTNIQVPILEDTYTDSNSPTTIRGDAAYALVKNHSNFDRVAYLKFDLLSIPGTITAATLHINGRTTEDGVGTVTVDVYPEGNDTWDEDTTTYNNFSPSIGALISSFNPSGSSYSTPYSVDITSYAEAERSGDGTLSLAFKLQIIDNGNDFRIVSKEDTGGVNLPAYLDITYTSSLSVTDFDDKEFSFYPNPANDKLSIQSSSLEIRGIDVFSIEGKKVLTIDNVNSNKLELKIGHLNKGIYLVKIFNSNGGYNTKKLIKK